MFPYRPSASLSALLLLSPALYAQVPARTMTVLTGATIPIRLTRIIDTKTAKQGDTFEGTVAANVFSGGSVALPIGTPVTGRVAAARAAGRLGTPADLILELVSVQANGQTIPVSSRQLSGRRPNSTSPMSSNAAIGTLLAGGQQIVITTDTLLQFQTAASLEVATPERTGTVVAHGDTSSRPKEGSIPNQADPYTFDIVGLRLGMSAQEALVALHSRVPQTTNLPPTPGAPQFTPAAKFTGDILAHGPRFQVMMTFTETYPFDPKRPEQLTTIWYTAQVPTTADRENYEQAVLSKYGPPVAYTKGVGGRWCNVGTLNGPQYACAPGVPLMTLRGNELILGDGGATAGKERAAWNRQSSGPPPL